MHIRRSILPVAALVGTLALSAPSSLDAQVCLGPPARPGEVAFAGDRNTQGVTTSYGGRFQANLGGAAAVGAGFSVDTFDDLAQNGFTTRLTGGLPRKLWKLSACPALELAYSEVTPRTVDGNPENPVHSATLAPGVGLGFEVSLAGAVSVGAHARPSLLLVFGEHERVRGGRGVEDPDGPVQAGLSLGALLRIDRIFVGVETLRSTLSGQPAALIRIGMLR